MNVEPTIASVRQALNRQVLTITASALLLLAAISVVAFIIIGPAPGASMAIHMSRLMVGGAIVVVSALTLLFVRWGRLRLAASVFLLLLYVLLASAAYWTGLGVRSAGLPLLVCLIMVAGYLLQPRAALVVAGIGVATAVFLFGAEYLGRLPGPTLETLPRAPFVLFVLTILFLLVGWITARYAEVFGRAVADEARARHDLEASERQLRSIVETEPECVKVVSPDGRLLQMNRAGLDMIEAADAAEAVGRRVDELVVPEHRAAYIALHRRVMAGEEATLEFKLTGMRGGRRWMETHAAPMRDGEGKVIAHLAVTRDITARKEADVERQRQEGFLRTVTNTIPGVVGYWDRELICRWANEGYRQWTGLTPENMLGRHYVDLFGEEVYRSNKAEIDAVLRGQRQQFERRATRPDGEEAYALIHYIPDGPPGDIQGFISVGWDMTELKTTQLSLEVANTRLSERTAQAEAANLAKNQFLATMSHEIRTPLNGVLGMAQLLLMPGLTADEQHDYARTILNSGQTLLALLNDILDLAKVEAGKLELMSVAFSPAQLVAESVALMSAPAEQKHLRVHHAWQGPERATYHGDPVRIRQMLGNLLSNAIKFTDQGGVRIVGEEMEALAGDPPAARRLRISVYDEGIGIPADKMGQLFQPFTQIDATETRRFGGTGLGLSIVRSLAQRMGGRVGVDSTEGAGSCFWFELPLLPVIDGEERRAEPRYEAPDMKPGEGRHVLVVDDNAINLRVVVVLLEKAGYRVSTAVNGEQAVAACAAGGLDAVIMDLQMPGMDGLEATRRLRAQELAQARPRLPVVALTANAFDGDRHACMEAGMDEFLTKPVNGARLVSVLERVLLTAGK